MQLGHDDLGGGDAFFLMDVDGDAAAIVAHRHRAIAIEDHIDPVAPAGEAFIDRIIDDFIDHVMQAGAIIGIADIHAGPLAHGIEALQNLDRIRAVFAAILVVFDLRHLQSIRYFMWRAPFMSASRFITFCANSIGA